MEPATRGSEEQGGRKSVSDSLRPPTGSGRGGGGRGMAGTVGVAHIGQDSNARRGATELKGHYARKITELPPTITPPGYWKTREPREGLRRLVQRSVSLMGRPNPHLFPSESHLQLVENGGLSGIVQSHDDNLVLWRHPGGKAGSGPNSITKGLNAPSGFPGRRRVFPASWETSAHCTTSAPLHPSSTKTQQGTPPPDPGQPHHSRTVEMIAEPRLPRSTFPEKRLPERSGSPGACQEKGSGEGATIAGNPRPLLARRTEARRALRPGVHRKRATREERARRGGEGLWEGAGEAAEPARSAHAGPSEPEVPQRIRPDPRSGSPRWDRIKAVA